MQTYVVLFRAVNVGGHNRLPMQSLRGVLEQAGYQGVTSYIQSGNVVLQATCDPTQSVAGLVESHFGFLPDLVAVSANAFDRILAANPYREMDGKHVHAYFCLESPTVDAAFFNQRMAADESWQVDGAVLYLCAPSGIGRSKLVAGIETGLGVTATGRNFNTLNRLQTMARAATQAAE